MFRHRNSRPDNTLAPLSQPLSEQGAPAPANKSRLSSPNLSYCLHVGTAFLCGFALAWESFFIADYHQELRQLRSSPLPLSAAAIILRNDSMTEETNLPPSSSSSSTQVEAGIYPLLRDFQCGHANLETPRVLAKGSHGRGRFVIDVGLGLDGQETLDAVANGFVVFGFEMMAGSMQGIQEEAAKRGLENRIYFVEFEADPQTGKPKPKSPLPKPVQHHGEQEGYAYIYNAGLSDASGAISTSSNANPMADLSNSTISLDWKPGMTPMLTLEEALPEWVDEIFFVKIGTQGWEAKVINGMKSLLETNRIQYVQYEFSPWLMAKAKSGDSFDLLQALPSMGAICFDMMGEHNKLARPSRQLHDYFKALNDGLNGNKYNGNKYYAAVAQEWYKSDGVGPWDDILCWFPAATK